MRYLQLTSDFTPDPMFGLGVHVDGLVRGLAANGDTAIVATRKSGAPRHETRHDGRVEVLNGDPGTAPVTDPAQFMGDRLGYNHTLLSILTERGAGIDVVHNHDTTLVPLACEIADIHKVPLVTTVHIPDAVIAHAGGARPRWLDRHVMRALESEGFRRSSAIITPSRATADLLRDSDPSIADRLIVREHPCPAPPRVTDHHDRPGPVRVLVVGRLDPYKGLENLVTALGRLPVGLVTCRFVGAGGMRRRLSELAADLGAEVTFTGRMSHHEVLESFDTADILVSPSPMETYGLAVQEAMSAGLAVITTDLPVFAERISDDVNGLLVPACPDGSGADVEALAAAIARLAADPALRRRLGEAAVRRRPPSVTEYAAALTALVAERRG